jgi:hypothetical protein
MQSFEVTIDRIEDDDKVVLKTEDNDLIIWPKSKLPAGAHEGEVFSVTIKDLQEKEKNGKALAKDILNEILGAE